MSDLHISDEALAQLAEDVLGEWRRAYARDLGAYPLSRVRADKWFPPVSRIDAAYGDRHLVCSCAPLEAYAHQIESAPGS